MKKVLISLVLAVALTLAIAVPAMATSSWDRPASVTVNTYISATIADPGTASINFGSLNPGTTNNAEVEQGAGNGAVTVTVAAETNVNCKIGTKASGDFTYLTNTIPLDPNATWADSNGGTKTTMTTSYAQVATSTAGTQKVQGVWHWLTVPTNTVPGTYTTTYSYKVDTSL